MSSNAPPRDESITALLSRTARELPGLFNDRIDLLALELHRAGSALLKVLAFSAAGALLAITAWLALWGVVTALLVAAGWSWVQGLALVMVVNLVAAVVVLSRVRALLRLLGLPATRRHLRFGSRESEPPPPPSEPGAAHEAARAAG